jgi:hypothetical protein
MWWQKNIIYLNNGSMFKNLFSKHGDEMRWKVQIFIFSP